MTSRILKHMGITKWVSRFQMPNAAKSVLIEQAIEEAIQEQTAQAIPSQPNNQSNQRTEALASSVVHNLTSFMNKDEPKKTEPTNKEQPQTTITNTTSNTPKFRYQAICINQYFCIVPMTMDIQQEISQSQMTFLLNVIFAKTNDKPVILNKYTYQWPLFQHDKARQDLEVAKNFFKDQLITHQKENQFEHIWIFGDLMETLQIESDFFENSTGDIQILNLATLEQSMQSAQAKQSLWQLIK